MRCLSGMEGVAAIDDPGRSGINVLIENEPEQKY
jgi:hypothetical protein